VLRSRWPCGAIKPQVRQEDTAEERKEWIQQLVELGYAASATATQRLAALLTRNEFKGIASLRNAEHPKHWMGIDGHTRAELEEFHKICRRQNAYARRAAVHNASFFCQEHQHRRASQQVPKTSQKVGRSQIVCCVENTPLPMQEGTGYETRRSDRRGSYCGNTA
jgi:hypothetical protein